MHSQTRVYIVFIISLGTVNWRRYSFKDKVSAKHNFCMQIDISLVRCLILSEQFSVFMHIVQQLYLMYQLQ